MAQSSNDKPSDNMLEGVYRQVIREMATRDQEMWSKVTARDEFLQREIMGLMSQIVESNSVDRVLFNGFSELSDQIRVQMEPLRSLAPQNTHLPDGDDTTLAALRRGLARPDFARESDPRIAVFPAGNPSTDSRSFAS